MPCREAQGKIRKKIIDMIGEERIYKGYWWLPSEPEEQIAGTLTIEPNGTVKLDLYGCFGNVDDYVIVDRKDDPAIFGRCYSPNSNLKEISLISCHSAITLNFSSDFPITKYTCRYALIGTHVGSMEKASFFKAYVDFKELAYWCPPKNITTTYKKDSISIRIQTKTDDAMPLTSFKLEDEITLNLKESATYQPDYPMVYIDQGTYLEIEKEDLTALKALTISRKFERFLSVATLSPVEHGKITLFSKQECQKDGEKVYYHPIELVTYLYKWQTAECLSRQDYLFRYEDVAAECGEMIQKLYSDKNIAQILSNLLDSLENRRVFTTNDFLVVIQALDGFAIRFRKEKDFLQQLTDLRNEFSDVGRVSLTDDDLKASKGSRHYYSHILKLEEKNAKHALDGWELAELTRKLRILLICCVMSFLGMKNDAINKLLNRCNHSIMHKI